MDAVERHSASWKGKKRVHFPENTRDEQLKLVFDSWEKGKVLDLGCGDGLISEYLLQLGHTVHSADYSSLALKMTQKRGIQNTYQFDFTKKFPFRSKTFDFVTWNDNAEHLLEPAFALSEIYRVLKPGGVLVITVPNMGYFLYRLLYVLKGNVPGTDGVRADGYTNKPWEWEHIRFFNPAVLQDFLQTHGFVCQVKTGYNYNRSFHSLAQYSPSLLCHGLLMTAVKEE